MIIDSKGGVVMDTTRSAQGEAIGEVWPALPYQEWQDTLDTLHMWTQAAAAGKQGGRP
jgi:hypothetical protein